LQHQFIWVVLRYRYALANALESAKLDLIKAILTLTFTQLLLLLMNFRPLITTFSWHKTFFYQKPVLLLIEAIKKEKS